MASEASDNLKSKATLNILDLIGEGKIGGLVNGNKSVFFNDTQLQNEDGTYNFRGVTSAWTQGENNQTIAGNFGNYIETPYNIGTQVRKAAPYTFAVVNPLADAVRVIVNLPSLSVTNTSTGDISGTSVQYKFQMSIDGGPFNDIPSSMVWGQGGTWSSTSTSITATSVAGATGIRASCKLNLTLTPAQTAYTYGSVQAQEFNGTAWVNLGPARKMTVQSQLTIESRYTITSDTYEVQSNFGQVRFVLGSHGTGVSLKQGTIYCNSATPAITISGKTRSKYQRKHIINIPRPSDSVEIRMVRLTDDSNSAYLANDTYLDSYYEIITLNMVYPNSALYGFSIDSEQFNQIPSRAYLVDGLYIKVPTNYDPVSRTYTGVWDGTFKVAMSNNPAWIMYDILTNARYGLGNFLNANQVDKATLYTIGRYCDELVSDGYGGYEPRFTLNTVINSREEAYKVISDIASVFRGMTYWSGGVACFTHDAPTDSSMIYGRANVIGGEFSYTGSARKDRHSVVHVTWNDPAENYKKKIEYVEDPELINTYGIRKLDTLAFGCSSRGQAARVGRWILYTEKYESDFITFKVGLDSAFVAPGEVVKIQDPARAGRRSAGRLLACTSTSATLDAPTRVGANGIISLMLANGSFVDREINESDTELTQVTWTNPLSELPASNAMWLLQEDDLLPVLARVVGVSQVDATSFEITAIEHNPSKYDAIEDGLALVDRPTSLIDTTFVHAPSQVSVVETQYFSAPGVLATKLLVTWTGDCTSHELVYQGISDTNKSNPIKIVVDNALTYEILNVGIGTYAISLTGINPLGKRSATVTVTEDVQGRTLPPSDIAAASAELVSNGVLLTWEGVTDADFKLYEVRESDMIGALWEESTFVTQTTQPRLLITEGLLFGSQEWHIKAVNTWGNYSQNEVAVNTKLSQIGQIEGVTITPGFRQFFVQYNKPDRVDFAGTRLHVSTEQYFIPDASTLVYDGPSTFMTVAQLHDGTPLDANTTYYVRLAAYSSIGTSEMEYSVEQSVVPVSPLQSAQAYLYQWATAEPQSPTGSSEYDWATAMCSSYTGMYGWSVSIPSNPGTPGARLWQASKPVTSTDYSVTTSTVDWDSGSLVVAATANGETGADGVSPALLKLVASGYAFTFNADGSPSPASQTIGFTAQLQNLAGVAMFVATRYNAADEVIDAVLMGGSGNLRTLTSDQMGSAAYIIVSAAVQGITDTARVVRLTNGAAGTAGSPGTNAISGLLTNESATVAATADGAVSDFTGAGGTFKVWDGITEKTGSSVTYSVQSTTNVSITLGTNGIYTVNSLSADAGSATLRAVYGGVTIDKVYNIAKSKAGATGSAGASGVQATQVRVYQWALTIPSGPTGTGTYTWASASATYTGGGGWSSTPGSSPSAGYTLWAATVGVLDAATALTTTINWSTASITAVGYAGTNGTNGTNGSPGSAGAQGASYRTSYARVSGNPTPVSGTITTTGNSSFPSSTQSTTTWGFAATWAATDPNPSSTNTLYQADGIYDPATGDTVWSTPYIASLKVGTLSAISANLGTITAGELSIGSSPAISGTTMTGSGAHLYPDGRIAFGSAAKNIVWDGTTLTINGNMITTGNIIDASITTAKIGDLQVGTAKIGDNAVTSAVYQSSSSSFTFTAPAGSQVLILCQAIATSSFASIAAPNYWVSTTVKKNGSTTLKTFKMAIAWESTNFSSVILADATVAIFDTGTGSAVTYSASTSSTAPSYDWAAFILKK